MRGSREYLCKVYEERNCNRCHKHFYVLKPGKKRRRTPAGIRPRSAKTCTTKCSKLLSRNGALPKSI